MRDLCLDEGTLHSYYDRQLAADQEERVVSHLATCSRCAGMARQVESDIELATDAFASELSLSVPTERLRTRLDEAIAGLAAQPLLHEENTASRLRSWFASLASTFNLSPQRAFGFASLLIFFVLAAVIGGVVMRQRNSETGDTVVAESMDEESELSFGGPGILRETPPTPVSESNTRKQRPLRRKSAPGTDNIAMAHRVLPGEKNYLQAISLLTEAIEVNGETSLKPTLLTDYKRNLAVVDQAVKASQRTARTNPNSADAAEMLFAVYQSKLDLLSAVAEQSRPMIAQR